MKMTDEMKRKLNNMTSVYSELREAMFTHSAAVAIMIEMVEEHAGKYPPDVQQVLNLAHLLRDKPKGGVQ